MLCRTTAIKAILKYSALLLRLLRVGPGKVQARPDAARGTLICLPHLPKRLALFLVFFGILRGGQNGSRNTAGRKRHQRLMLKPIETSSQYSKQRVYA